jgi:hypothetical protein
VRELLRAGASVTVQFDSVREQRAAGSVVDDAVVYLGPLAPLDATRALVDAVVPDIVIHCVALDASGERNVEGYSWEEIVMTTERLLRALSSRPSATLSLLSFWGQGDTKRSTSRMAAVAEALVLNRSLGRRITASSVRFPHILTEARVRAVLDGLDESTFDLLETEAAAIALETATSGAHGLFTPVWQGTVAPSLVRAAASRSRERDGAGTGEDAAATAQPTRSGPVFPAEQLQEVASPGIKRVVGPLYPAHDALKGVVAGAPIDASEASRQEWIEVVGVHLYQIVPSGLRFTGGL